MKRLFGVLLFVLVLPVTATMQPLQALSADTKMFISGDNTFYAYVRAGESIGASFLRVNQDEPFDTPREDVTITMDGPGAEEQKCVASKDVPIGQGCVFAPRIAQKSGIWRIRFDVPATAKSYMEVSPDVQWGKNLFMWNITVKYNADEQKGRIWTERYAIRQPADRTYATDFTYFYVSEDGYIYKAEYKGYNGQISTLSADGIGIRKANSCESAYQSANVGSEYSQTLGSCGNAYKLFFEEPAGNLPVKASTWEGKEEWVRPNISRPAVSELRFIPDESNDQQSGTVSFVLKNFIGQYEVKIDVDDDGSFDGQDDVTIRQQMKRLSAATQKVRFDGTDKVGRIIARDQKIGVKLAITKVAEIHLVSADVEGRTGGIALTRVSGDNAPTTGLCWNDKELSPLASNLMPTVVDGRDCPTSVGGVHGWAYADSSWGNARYIEDWVYATAKLTGNSTVVYPNDEQETVAAASRNVGPIVIGAVAAIVLIGSVVIVLLRRRTRAQQSPRMTVMQPPAVPPAGYPPTRQQQPPINPNPYDGQPPQGPNQ